MDFELLAILLGAVLPLYPALFSIHQKIGKYDVICTEFVVLQEEHNRYKEQHNGP